MRNHRESVSRLWSQMASALEYYVPVSPLPVSGVTGLASHGVLDSVFVWLAGVDVSPPYTALHDALRLAICTVGYPLCIVNTRSQSRAIGEVVALVALLAGITLSPELLGRYGRHSKNRDPVSVLHVRTSWLLASLPSPASHALDPLALFCHS